MGTILQSKFFQSDAATSHVVTFDNPTTAGSAIVMQFDAFEADSNGTMTIIGTTGNNGETYANVPSAAGSTLSNVWQCATFVAPNVAGRSGHQVTLTTSESAYVRGIVTEVSGIDTSTPVDTGNTAAGAASQPSGAAATASAAGLHLAHIAIIGASASSFTPGAGWTEALDANDASQVTQETQYRTAANGVAQTPSATAGLTPDNWQITHVILKDAAGGSAGNIAWIRA